MTPLGVPVEPEVYMTMAVSSAVGSEAAISGWASPSDSTERKGRILT